MATAASDQKRQALRRYIIREIEPEPAVQSVVVIGSVAQGTAQPDSDVDAVVFLDPFDPYAVPAECQWCPADGSYHSTASEIPRARQCLQLDFARLDLSVWIDPSYVWPEGRRAELASGWIAFDRSGWIIELITARTHYASSLREDRLDTTITWLNQHLSGDRPCQTWKELGPTVAHDRLNAAHTSLVQALFAYHRRWQPWRNRRMSALLALPWLPEDFETRIQTAMLAPSPDYEGYAIRVEALRGLFQDLLDHLISQGDYGDDPISEAFIRSHDEPGRSWNMDAWCREHRARSIRRHR